VDGSVRTEGGDFIGRDQIIDMQVGEFKAAFEKGSVVGQAMWATGLISVLRASLCVRI
jgi:hypothetical protein